MASPVDTSVKFTHARLPGALDFGSGADLERITHHGFPR
nr:MAG TPA: hypothetical protein [Caudoviricetes sp.]